MALDSRLCGVSTQLHPRISAMPAPALALRSLATNFGRYPGYKFASMSTGSDVYRLVAALTLKV